jgi:hypothetical protein
LNDGSKDGIKLGVILESTNPRKSRDRFISRHFRNIVFVVVLFILAVMGVSHFSSILVPGAFMPMLVCDVIALAGAYYFYILWDNRPIRVRCRNCRKVILSNTPWFCVVCKKPNLNATQFPFVYKCEHCGAEPKAYRCHNPACKQLIYLSEDEDATNYVYCLNSPNDVSEENERAKKVKTYQDLKEDREHQILMAEGDVTLADLKGRYKFLKSRLRVKKKQPAIDSKRENLQEFFGSSVAAEQAAREQKAANAEDCKNDPKERKRRDRIVDFWLEREMAGENDAND